MAKMYPEVFPGKIDQNNPEYIVYQALRSLPESYIVFYSKRFAGGLFGKPECEIDFVIFNQRDVVICLEVKGGVLHYNGAQDYWLQNGKIMDQSPDRQAAAATHCLMRELSNEIRNVNVDWALCFPQCSIVDGVSPVGVPLNRIFDESRLAKITSELPKLENEVRSTFKKKGVSAKLLDPLALIKLRETGRCFFSLPEEIFDLDYPGHYFRCIKSLNLAAPCTLGPYITFSCTLRLLKNSIRINTTNGDNGYPRNTDDQGLPADDDRFIENNIPVKAIATSRGQNDSGVFELSFRDERYLPFEGAGVISDWSLELFSDLASNNPDPANPDFGRPLRQFDYSTISDVILNINFTAREDAGAFKNGAVTHLREYFSQTGATHSLRSFNLRQEFPDPMESILKSTESGERKRFGA